MLNVRMPGKCYYMVVPIQVEEDMYIFWYLDRILFYMWYLLQ